MSAITKVNNSGLSHDEKKSLKEIIVNIKAIRDQIAEDDCVDDHLLRVYLNGITRQISPEKASVTKSALIKVNSSGLSLDEKMSLKVVMVRNVVIRDQIAEDDCVDDDLLRVYLNGTTQPLIPMPPDLDGFLRWLFGSRKLTRATSASAVTASPCCALLDESTCLKEESPLRASESPPVPERLRRRIDK